MSTARCERLEAEVAELRETVKALAARVTALEVDRSYREGREWGISLGRQTPARMTGSSAGSAALQGLTRSR